MGACYFSKGSPQILGNEFTNKKREIAFADSKALAKIPKAFAFRRLRT
jgi:hypothetical protein